MEIIPTKQRKQKVCLDGFMYGCKGVISTSIDLSQVLNTKPHNHDANTMEVAVAKTKADMKHLAANTRERPAKMVSTKLAELPAAAIQLAGEEETMKKMIRRI